MSTSCQIRETDGTLVDVTGYTRCRLKTTFAIMGYVLTVGILRIIFHWFPQFMLQSTHRACPLHEAQRVLVKDSCGVYYIEKVHTHKPTVLNGSSNDPCRSTSHALLLSSGLGEGEYLFFVHKKMKYLLTASSEEYILLPGWEDRPFREIIHSRPLSQNTVERSMQLFGPNEIYIQLTPIIKLLLTECFSPFYCFQVFSCILWFIDEYEFYASCIIIVSTISLCVEVYEVRRNERALKRTVNDSTTIYCCREIDGTSDFRETHSITLVPGDVIEIPKNGCVMQCDSLLLTGSCIVNESTLTGESVPITKTAISDRSRDEEAFNIKTHARHVLFCGTSVIQTRNYVDERVVALVLRTGFRTTKGELVRCILYPKPMRFKFTQDIHKVLLCLAIVASIGFGFSIYLMVNQKKAIQVIIARALDIVTVVVPPALPAAMTAGIVFAQRRLRHNGIYCINPSVINVCSAINVVCFDKTGTLTEDGLDLWGVVQSEEGTFNEPEFDPSKLERGPLLEAMATCHSLTRIEGVLSGDPLDLKMFQSTKWELIEEVSEDHCKFEMAVPAIVRPVDCGSVTNITVDTTIDSDAFPYEVGIIRQFPFTSGLQRMSVVARVLNGSHFNVYTKGAPETIESLCRPDTIPMDFHSILLDYTREGYRVIAIAWRPLKFPYTRIVRAHRDQVERDLQFLGLIIMENRLKPETAPVISEILRANIRPVMVTGDNMLTALSVARDCEMIDEPDRIIIVSAKPPPKPVSGIECVAGGDAGHSLAKQPSSVEITNGPSALSIDSTVPVYQTTSADHIEAPLVEFHYAEDLHKPVTEVTTTTQWPYQGRNIKCRRQPNQHLHEQFSQSSLNRVGNAEEPLAIRNDGSHSAVLFSSDQPNGSGSHASPSRNVLGLPVTDFNAVSPSHLVSICILDRPDFHLAISGKMWAIINEHYPWLIPKLVVKGTVFARFSPDQKAQLVEALQSVGYYVAMCGDGANDCGALKVAHAGISLSAAEASVASPFTSKQQNISCVPNLIREGRCALVTSFGIVKFMIGYSLLQFFFVILVYFNGTNLSSWQYVYIDFFLLTTLSITFGLTGAYRRLSVEPPTIRLLSFVTMMSLVCQIMISLAIQLLAFILVKYQPWYFPLFSIIDREVNANYENTAVFDVSVYQYIILAMAFSKSSRYRRSLLTNIPFVINLVACFGFNVVLTIYPFEKLLEEFELLRIPSTRFIILLHTLVLTNFLLSWLLELTLDGVAFRRRILHIRKALFPKLVQRKAYEHIRDELDRMAGIWPPIIRSASVQALPRDLFTDGNVPDTCNAPVRQRKRNVSSHSDDTDGGEFSPVYGDHQLLVTINTDSAAKQRRKLIDSSPHRRHSSYNASPSRNVQVEPQCTLPCTNVNDSGVSGVETDIRIVKQRCESSEQTVETV